MKSNFQPRSETLICEIKVLRSLSGFDLAVCSIYSSFLLGDLLLSP